MEGKILVMAFIYRIESRLLTMFQIIQMKRSSRERLSNLLALATNVISRRAGDDAPGLLVVSDVIDPVLSTLTPILSHFLPITLSLCINDEAGDNRHNRELKVRTAYGQPAPPSLSWFIGVDDHGCSLQVLHQK